MIISFAGWPGSGKSTIAKRIATELGWPYYSMGQLRREAAKRRGMTLEEYNKLAMSDISTDLEVDEYQTKLGQEQDNFVIDGRTSWHFIPQSYKIFLNVDPRVGAERIFQELQQGGDRNEGHNLTTVEAVLNSNYERVQNDRKRYQKYFGIDVYDLANYDEIVDTTNLTIEEVVAKVRSLIKQRLAQDKVKN
ncbi:cytidylate kinase family protein [Patescibacteria group bacterium]|jgi:cytidylate kinase|nr:cytidylate kinase family protein [Patescibacteria group bacterium]HPD07829.1 (d)CMP kinase [bacterium]HRT11220.1 (d)CMP kinase [Patescibacteria group bacterium]HRU90039.1 (d)CMP kinase [Patescibacteria group bacterium]